MTRIAQTHQGVPVTVTAGRLTLPAAARQTAGIPADGLLVAIPHQRQIVLMPRAEVLRRARAVVHAALAQQGMAVSDVQNDLAEQRRLEATTEAGMDTQ